MTVLFCNEILVRFLNLPDIFGFRHSQLPLKIQFCSFSKTGLRLSSKLAFFPSSPTLSHIPREPALAVDTVAGIRVQGRGMISSLPDSSILSLVDLISLLPWDSIFLASPSCLPSVSNRRPRLWSHSPSPTESVSGLLEFNLVCLVLVATVEL